MYNWCIAYDSPNKFTCAVQYGKQPNTNECDRLNFGAEPTMTGNFYFQNNKDAMMFALQCLGAKDE